MTVLDRKNYSSELNCLKLTHFLWETTYHAISTCALAAISPICMVRPPRASLQPWFASNKWQIQIIGLQQFVTNEAQAHNNHNADHFFGGGI